MAKEVNKEVNIRAIYSELNKLGQNGEYEKALKSANRILGVSADEPKAIHCKLVCQIQLAKFTEAIQMIDRLKLTEFAFEKAYCEYRLNQPDKALKTVEECGLNPLPDNFKELKAQILYRLENYEDAYDTYRDIIKNTSDDYDDERLTNLSAVIANLEIEGSKREIATLREDTYELSYNRACGTLGKNQLNEAEKKLRISEKLCRESLEEDGASEEDIQEEIAIIRVQLAYCLQMQGKIKEASVIYADTFKNKSKDPALVAVASNNLVVINKEQNVFDSKKKMRAALNDACEHKLTSRHKKTIALNNALLSLYTNSQDCHQLCGQLIKKYPDTEFVSILIRVSHYVREKKIKDAIDLLESVSKSWKNSVDQLALKFALVQLMLLNSNKKGAIDVLQSLKNDEKYSPGVVSALVTLHLGMDNKTAASQVLKDAVEWYKKNKGNAGDLTDMWRQAADFHLRGGQAEIAASSLEELLKNNQKDMKILAQLVIAYAQYNPAKAQEISKRLPALETMTTVSEIDQLESTNWMMSTKAVKKTAIRSDQSPGSELAKPKKNTNKKKKRKGKLPKNYDASVQPDPERWLPKYERTGFRRKRDRRTKDVIKGSQGMSSGAADQYDMTKSANLHSKSATSTPYQEPTPGPRQQQRKNQPKKKKGRH